MTPLQDKVLDVKPPKKRPRGRPRKDGSPPQKRNISDRQRGKFYIPKSIHRYKANKLLVAIRFMDRQVERNVKAVDVVKYAKLLDEFGDAIEKLKQERANDGHISKKKTKQGMDTRGLDPFESTEYPPGAGEEEPPVLGAGIPAEDPPTRQGSDSL